MKFGVLIIVFWILVLLPFCKGPGTQGGSSTDLNIATGVPIGEIDPIHSRSGMGANLIELLYRPLFRIRSNGQIKLELAKSMQWMDKGKSLNIILTEDLANDVKDTVEKVKHLSGSDLYEGMKNLQSIEVVSSRDIIFHMNRFDRAFPILLSQIPIVAFSKNKPETGEFEINNINSQEVTLRRKLPSFDKVNIIRFIEIPSPRRAIRELVAGNIDLLFSAKQSDYDVLKDLPNIEISELTSRMLYQVLNNHKSKPEEDNDWRFINRHLDREGMMREIGQQDVVSADLPVPTGDFWYLTPKDVSAIPMSKGDRPLQYAKHSLSFLGEQERERRIARVLKRHFESLGLELKLLNLSPDDYNKKIYLEKDFELVLLPFNVKDTLVSNYLVFHSSDGPYSLNISGYNNPQVDRYFEEARYTEDDQKAKESFAKAMEVMAEDPPGLFLFWLKTPIVYRKSCSGFNFNSNEFFSSLKDVRCEPSAAN